MLQTVASSGFTPVWVRVALQAASGAKSHAKRASKKVRPPAACRAFCTHTGVLQLKPFAASCPGALEGMLDARINLDFATLNFSAATLMNFDSDRDDIGLQLAASLICPLAGGFTLIPGVAYLSTLGTTYETSDILAIGVALRYGF